MCMCMAVWILHWCQSERASSYVSDIDLPVTLITRVFFACSGILEGSAVHVDIVAAPTS